MTTSILHFNFKTPAVIHGGVFCALLDFFAPLRLGCFAAVRVESLS